MTWVADTPFTAPRWSEPGAVESAAARPFTPTRPPRHVHLIPSLSLGGAERIVADLACCYAECGTAADLVILRNSAVEHPLRAGTGAGEGTGAGVAVHRLGALPWPERHARATEVIRASGLPAYCHLLSAPDLARLWRLGCRTVPVVHNAAAGWTAERMAEEYPGIEPVHLQAAAAFAADLMHDESYVAVARARAA